jgi:hypothetical protein
MFLCFVFYLNCPYTEHIYSKGSDSHLLVAFLLQYAVIVFSTVKGPVSWDYGTVILCAEPLTIVISAIHSGDTVKVVNNTARSREKSSWELFKKHGATVEHSTEPW